MSLTFVEISAVVLSFIYLSYDQTLLIPLSIVFFRVEASLVVAIMYVMLLIIVFLEVFKGLEGAPAVLINHFHAFQMELVLRVREVNGWKEGSNSLLLLLLHKGVIFMLLIDLG